MGFNHSKNWNWRPQPGDIPEKRSYKPNGKATKKWPKKVVAKKRPRDRVDSIDGPRIIGPIYVESPDDGTVPWDESPFVPERPSLDDIDLEGLMLLRDIL